jgi:hypothetical protein
MGFLNFIIVFFLNEIFCNFLLKLYSFLNTSYVNLCWIIISFLKVRTFCQILCLILKNDHNFKSYQNMLIILSFSFLFHKLQLCFVFHVHYILITCGKKKLKIQKFRTSLNFLKISNSTNFEIVSVFWIWVISYYHFNFFLIKFFLLIKFSTWFFVKLSLFKKTLLGWKYDWMLSQGTILRNGWRININQIIFLDLF